MGALRNEVHELRDISSNELEELENFFAKHSESKVVVIGSGNPRISDKVIEQLKMTGFSVTEAMQAFQEAAFRLNKNLEKEDFANSLNTIAQSVNNFKRELPKSKSLYHK